MAIVPNAHQTLIRTERGLSIAGTRITIYDVMDYIAAGFTPAQIQDRLGLNDRQIDDVMNYIRSHRAKVEAEYKTILQTSQENRRYWEARNQEKFAQVEGATTDAEQKDIREKLREWKARVESNQC